MPIGDSEMPPLTAQSVETGISHCDLEQMRMPANCWIAPKVMPHRGWREIIKVGGHRDRAMPRIDQRGIDGDPPAVQRTGPDFGIGDMIIVMRRLPQLHLHGFRAIRIPDF